MDQNKEKKQEEEELDWIIIFQRIWSKRKFVFKVTLLFILLGGLIAFFSAKEYTAHCIIVPQFGEKVNHGNLGGLAEVAGIHFLEMNHGEILSPQIYPKILSSVPFQKELMYMKLRFEEHHVPITILDYYTNEAYKKTSFLEKGMSYLFGLPRLLINAFFAEQTYLSMEEQMDPSIYSLSKEEHQCMRILREMIHLNVNEKEGVLTLSAKMPNAVAAAQLVATMQMMLQKYITEFKIEKAKLKLQFIEERYREAKKQFEEKQKELAEFRDANRNVASALAQTMEERLSNEYTIALSVYGELAKQREHANIQVKEDTPIFTIIEPVTIPKERSKPQRTLIVLAFSCLGVFVGVGTVLLFPFIAQIWGKRHRIDKRK